jgi:hypothetical protein
LRLEAGGWRLEAGGFRIIEIFSQRLISLWLRLKIEN